MQSVYTARIKKIQSTFRLEHTPAALLLSSAPDVYRSRGTSHTYRQSGDFYYLTGCTEKDLALLITAKKRKPILFARSPSSARAAWDGRLEDPKIVAHSIGAELVLTQNIKAEALPGLRGIEKLYYQNISGTAAWNITQELMALPSHERRAFPGRFEHADALLGPLRLRKDRSELNLIRQAIQITHNAMLGAMPLVCAGSMEYEVAATLEYSFRVQEAGPAFQSIAAAGPSAAILHYSKLDRALKAGQMLLLDCGAEYRMYAADISRVFPVGGRFTPLQRELLEVVLAAQAEEISKIKPGISVERVHLAGARELTRGLVDLGVLKGKVSKLMAQKAYKPFFPHLSVHRA